MGQDYFMSFMDEVLRELKKKGKSFVFNEEQVKYIKEKIGNIEVKNDNGIFYITSLTKNIDKN